MVLLSEKEYFRVRKNGPVNKQQADQSKKHRKRHFFLSLGLNRQISVFWQSIEDWTFLPAVCSGCEIPLNDLLSKRSILIAGFYGTVISEASIT